MDDYSQVEINLCYFGMFWMICWICYTRVEFFLRCFEDDIAEFYVSVILEASWVALTT
jgi:hypothetical protein